jgi:6-phosphogluconolactonase (cycloisomerase 2 family)
VGNDLSGDITIFSINPVTGAPSSVGSPVPSGNGLISITVDPSGRYLYGGNFTDNSITAYSIDGPSGFLTPITGPVRPPTEDGIFYLTVDVTGKFVYAANLSTNNLSAYEIDLATGELTTVAPSGIVATGEPDSVDTVCIGQ